MITIAEMNIIKNYVDEQYFDREKLVKYLNMHSIVGNEIFSYCDKGKGREGSSHSNWLDDEYGYSPLPVSDFIRRVPFYFYVNDYSDHHHVGDLGCLISGVNRFQRQTRYPNSCQE